MWRRFLRRDGPGARTPSPHAAPHDRHDGHLRDASRHRRPTWVTGEWKRITLNPWVFGGCLLMFSVTAPICGKLSDIFGRRPHPQIALPFLCRGRGAPTSHVYPPKDSQAVRDKRVLHALSALPRNPSSAPGRGLGGRTLLATCAARHRHR